MEDQKVKTPVLIYTEQTPNPETLKFVSNRMLYRGTADMKDQEFAKTWSPLATQLFERPYVKAIYISNNYVTITKEFSYSWEDIMLELKQELKDYIADEKPIINDGFEAEIERLEEEQGDTYDYTDDEKEIVKKIKELINTYVKPAVEMDGGNIEFKKYSEGIVTVVMQGACSGCPSSTVTLKAGIEGMLKRMVPEVKEVVSEMGQCTAIHDAYQVLYSIEKPKSQSEIIDLSALSVVFNGTIWDKKEECDALLFFYTDLCNRVW